MPASPAKGTPASQHPKSGVSPSVCSPPPPPPTASTSQAVGTPSHLSCPAGFQGRQRVFSDQSLDPTTIPAPPGVVGRGGGDGRMKGTSPRSRQHKALAQHSSGLEATEPSTCCHLRQRAGGSCTSPLAAALTWGSELQGLLLEWGLRGVGAGRQRVLIWALKGGSLNWLVASWARGMGDPETLIEARHCPSLRAG